MIGKLGLGLAAAVIFGAGAFLFLKSGAVNTSAITESPAAVQTTGRQFTYNFDSDKPGAIPPHFHAALTGGGPPPNWVVQADATAPSKPNVLTQTTSDRTDYRFPLAIADEDRFQDFTLSVRFKAISGEVDRAAGLVFRVRDASNYYVARANALGTGLPA